jgi:hypothetical protein
VSIGNGVMDMFFQEPSYAEYAYYHGLIPLGAKIKFERDWAKCLESVRSKSWIVVVKCVGTDCFFLVAGEFNVTKFGVFLSVDNVLCENTATAHTAMCTDKPCFGRSLNRLRTPTALSRAPALMPAT